MEIKIIANKFLYYKDKTFETFEVKLQGNLQYQSNEPILVHLDKNNLFRIHGLEKLNEFCKDIRGISKVSFENSENQRLERIAGSRDIFEEMNVFSFNTFKALFLLFDWLEIPLMNQEYNELDIEKTFYDDFVVDWTNKPESQNDIYLIKKEHIIEKNFEALHHLIKINLLCEISISPYKKQEIISYFTPLNQPGIPKELFYFTDSKSRRVSAYNFWRTIIEERDTRIRNWSINRF